MVFLKQKAKQKLLQLARIRRIHITGCSRSGTTMLHFAFIAFAKTILYDKEISPWTYPELRETVKFFLNNLFNTSHLYLISKRNAPWWQKERLDKLLAYSDITNTQIILIVRDPRDVLTSKHPLDKKRYYVDPELWMNSIIAGNYLEQYLPGNHFLKIRYEDVINEPEYIAEQFKKRYNLSLRAGVRSMALLKDNMETLNIHNSHMVAYMHNMRNLDSNSIGKWQKSKQDIRYIESLMKQKELGAMIIDFMRKHGYI